AGLPLAADASAPRVAAEALAHRPGLHPRADRIGRDVVDAVHRCAPVWVRRLTRLRFAARLASTPLRPAYFFSSCACTSVETVVSTRYQTLATMSSSMTR